MEFSRENLQRSILDRKFKKSEADVDPELNCELQHLAAQQEQPRYLLALKHATEPQVRGEKSKGRDAVGGMALNKKNGLNAYGADVAQFLVNNRGTFGWNPEDEAGLFDTIYQRVAADVYCADGNGGQRYRAGREFEENVVAGIGSLVKWLDRKYGVAIYRPQGYGTGNLVRYITVDPNFIVDSQGTTASKAQIIKDAKALDGTISAVTKRLTRAVGTDKARLQVNEMCHKAMGNVDTFVERDLLDGPKR